MRRPTATAVLTVLALVIGLLGVARPASAAPEHVTVASPADGLEIHISVYKPSSATAENQAPVILHSHGWSGSRTSSDGAFGEWLDAGFGVVSIDQRGHGDTGGTAHVQNPDLEGQDIIGVIDYVASLDWVQLDGPGDPVLGAIGGSYGGGYQMIGALTEIRDRGSTRFNALAPQITWNNLPQSLGPNDVPRTLWNVLLYAVGAPILPDYVHQSFLLGNVTGTFPNGEIPATYNLKDRFYRNSPAWFAENGYQLDIPVLFGQGTSDNLFPLNEAYHNFTEVLTPDARAESLLVGYNGGHVLPATLPSGESGSGDACSGEGGFAELSREFFATAFAGGDTSALLPTPYSITTVDGACVHVESLDSYTAYPVGTIVTPSVAGVPLTYEIAQGPITVAGIPKLRGALTSLGLDARAFFALSAGPSAEEAQVIQGNTMPLRQRLPVVGEATELELAGVAVEVPEGEKLFLTVSAVADMFVGTSRVPGALLIEGAEVDLPVVG